MEMKKTGTPYFKDRADRWGLDEEDQGRKEAVVLTSLPRQPSTALDSRVRKGEILAGDDKY